LIDKKPTLIILIVVFFLNALVPFCYFWASSLSLIFLSAVFNGLAAGGLELGRINYIMKLAGKRRSHDYWAVDSTLMGIRGCIFPFVGVKLMQIWGIKPVFLLSFITMFAGAIFLVDIYRRERRNMNNEFQSGEVTS